MTTRQRSHIRVVRSDNREFPSLAVAFRELNGTTQELGYSEHLRLRAAIRATGSARDRHGFTWRSVGGLVPEATINWTDFTFGIEIELYAQFSMMEMTRRLNNLLGADHRWKVKYDGSLNQACPRGWEGMEVVSPILQGQSGLDVAAKVMDMIRDAGCKVNDACGFHVHIGVRGMKPERVRKIAIAFLNAERHFDSIVPPSRRNNRYAQSNVALVRRLLSQPRLENATTIQSIGTAINGGNDHAHYNPYRYYKLNLQSFVHHGTIEFRQHSGTVESAKALAWVRMIAGFCARAAASEQEAFGAERSFEEWLPTVTDEAGVRYLTERRVKFQTRAAIAA